MDVSSQQIVSGLIAYYKQQGVDLAYLLGDPTFQSLRLKDKIDAIHQHAAELHNGTSYDLTKEEKRKILGRSLLTAGAALPAFATLAMTSPVKTWFQGSSELAGAAKAIHNRALWRGAGGVVAASLVAGALKGGLEASQTLSDRRALKAQLYNAATNPSLTNTLGVLSQSTVAKHQHPYRDQILGKAYEMMDNYWDPDRETHKYYGNYVNGLADDRKLPDVETVGNLPYARRLT